MKHKVLVVIKNKYIHTHALVMYSLNFISEYVALSYNFDYTTLYKQVFLGMEIVFKSIGKLFASYLPE